MQVIFRHFIFIQLSLKLNTVLIKVVGSSVVTVRVFSSFDIHSDPVASEFDSSICSRDELHFKFNTSFGACSTKDMFSSDAKPWPKKLYILTFVPLLVKTVQLLKQHFVDFWTCGVKYLQIGISTTSFQMIKYWMI